MSRRRKPIRLATRGSSLARAQARSVAEELERRRYDVELVEVETTGDQLREELLHRLGTTGAFVRALDERILAGEVDAAVHSMKDVPTEGPDELVTAAVPPRGPANDVLVTPNGDNLADLPEGAVVGTASLRRRAQLLGTRPDLRVEPIRGNVDTRLEKLLAPAMSAAAAERRAAAAAVEAMADAEADAAGTDAEDGGGSTAGESGSEPVEGVDTGTTDSDDDSSTPLADWRASLSAIEGAALERAERRPPDAVDLDAIVLSKAGLTRIGLLDAVETVDLPIEEAVPAPGQGAIAVTALEGELVDLIRTAVDHPRTRVETTVERTVLAELGGGCIAPLGIHAVTQGEYVHVVAAVYDRKGEATVRGGRDLPITDYREAARSVADDLADRGATDLIAAAKRAAVEDGADE